MYTNNGEAVNWLKMDIESLQAAYADGDMTPSHVVRQFVEQSDNAEYSSVWISKFSPTELLDRARQLEQKSLVVSISQMPLYGVLIAVKDNIDVFGLPTTAACPAFAYNPVHSAQVIELLESAGAIIVGKTNLDQFATGLVGVRSPYGEVPNAFNPDYISGGSSSGSAVSVALGQVHMALGTDTAGSGRVPAALNNLVGLKPSRGIVSTEGLVPACRSLDCISIFARTAADAARALKVMTQVNRDPMGRPAKWAGTASRQKLRIAVPRPDELTFLGDSQAQQAFHEALEVLRSIGATIQEVSFAPFNDAAKLLYDGPFVAERLEAAGPLMQQHPEALDQVVAAVIRKGEQFSALSVFESQSKIAVLRRQALAMMAGYDALVVPSIPTIYTRAQLREEPIKRNSDMGTYTNGVNLLDFCALSVPACFRQDGMPAGVTLIAPALHDLVLARIGQRIQQQLMLPLGATDQPYPASGTPVNDAAGTICVAVVGAHLSGMPLNGQLTERQATLLSSARTAPQYHLYHLKDTVPPKPGLIRTMEGGASIDVEIWEMPIEHFGSFVSLIPAPLGIGTITLEDGSTVKSFICEGIAVEGALDVTRFGGWKNYMKSLQK